MSDTPATFANALEEAELVAFGVLCSATGMVSGRNAFIGYTDLRIGVMTFGLSDSFSNDPAFWAAHTHTQLPFNAEATGSFRTRREVFTWALRIVEAMPITAPVDTLRLFRVSNLDRIQAVIEKDSSGKLTLLGWEMTVQFNTVCATGGKS